MKSLFLIITVALFPICLPYDQPVIEEVRPQRVSRLVQAPLPSPVATEEAKPVERVARPTADHIVRADKKVYVPHSEIEKKICELWKDRCDVAIAVFKAESGLNPTAMGWNCYYYQEDGSRYSAACKTEADRANAWSVDCGVTQMNVAGKTCPNEYFDPIWNIEKAYAWKYVTRGNQFTAWVAYTTGKHLAFLQK